MQAAPAARLVDELRSVEVVDWDSIDPSDEAQSAVGFGYNYDEDLEAVPINDHQRRGGAKTPGADYDSDEDLGQRPKRHATVDADQPAVFTAPQEVTNEEYDAVQHLLQQAKAAKDEVKQLTVERKKMEIQLKGVKRKNEQLEAENRAMKKEADEIKAEQLKKLVEANARLAATKGKDPNSAKKQEELQRALEGAEGYLLDELEEEKKSGTKSQRARDPWHKRLVTWYKATVHRLQEKMGHKEYRFVEARFGQGIAVYFAFLRYLWTINVLSFVVGGTVVIYQLVLISDPSGLVMLPAGSGQFPRFLLLSLFPASGAVIYSVILSTLGFFLVGMAVKKYSEEKAEEKKEEVVADEESNKFSKLAFAGWDFKMYDKSSIEDAMIQASENMNMALKENEVLEKIANRSQQEKNRLLAKKVFGIFVNVLLILASWFTIGSLTYLSAPGRESFFSNPEEFFGKIHSALPMTNLALIVINGVLPAITNLLIQFEKYDAPATQFQMETSRLYFGKILNALVLMYTGANSYVGGSQLQLPGVSAFWMAAQSGDACAYGVNPDPTYATKASGTSSDWPCPEDELGFVLFKTIALDFFVGKAVAVAIGEAKRALARAKKQPVSAAKSDFQTSTMVIQLLYTQALAWLAVPYVPIILLWMPFMWYLNFKWEYWVLCRYMKKPLRTFETRQAMAFIANFFVLSLAIALLNLYFFLSKSTCVTRLASGELCATGTPVQGGPFNDPTPLQTPVSVVLPSSGIAASIVNSVASPVVAYALVVVYVTKYVLEKKHRTVTLNFAKSKQVELQEQLQLLSRQMAKKDQKLAFLEKAREKRSAGS